MDRDRTYGSAVALRNWFRDHNMLVSGIDVITEDLHARRTRLLFQKALWKGRTGRNHRRGERGLSREPMVALQPGLKDVVSEFAAYLYARLFFWPTPEGGRRTESREQRAESRWEGMCLACPTIHS